ncbi:bifunctional 3-(3-hydroxy-phenyl)propionate/3-hydroxycinnamic acid hydroxylase [Ruixingdingia sedimenti]|uniref:Bifunctional 3-(3-hydroxy-phenyl)propionate/3-hydroxycinnamic acid hydroxylase n=1 Tax=Ruixingdingia sedimenti TaxID=3073604 RepID=A0ABU1F7P3_9RHOB|nr:bifunctional 3-(3-hydroxy-phenyl)propionate/3-hydroxycinnamic acid hydroxylase [Xinfangfangia sp. LG-4]MDR5652882.1 bifunctional 3-(3-hydroxy-phenyl)propionate/3-hydroxycinnamic acid hydroxylase [Xinfangfangia sp. LG-4]
MVRTAEAHGVEVAVIGLGPVGITLCNLLADMGVSTVGIDAAADVYALPRAIGMDHEVMRVFQQIGLAGALAPHVGAYRRSEYRAADGGLLRLLDSPPEPWPLSWPPYLTFVQPELERCLRARLADRPGVRLRAGVELTGIETPETPVLTLRDTASGQTETLRPRFVVGCDGGNSFVRRSLGIGFEDLDFDEPWLVVDMIVDGPVDGLPETNVQYCDPARPHTHVIGPGGLRRWEFMMLPGEDPAGMNREERIWDLLSPWLKPGQARLWRSATYRFHALVARDWRRGRVFLAGDACHMTPPFLAQGMVQGVKDAANLAWKLAAVLREGRAEPLLDSYQAERRPLVREVIAITKGLGRIICERDPDAAAARNARMLAELAAGQGRVVRQNLFPPIADGLIARLPDGTPAPGAGLPCPQPWVVTGTGGRQRLDDVAGHGFRLLLRAGGTLSPAAQAAARGLGITVQAIARDRAEPALIAEEHGLLNGWLDGHGADAVLVRPDHVVFGTSASDAGLRAMLDQLRAQLG